MTFCLYAFVGFLANFCFVLKAQSTTTTINYDPRDFVRHNLTQLYPKDGTASQLELHPTDQLPPNCPQVEYESPSKTCQLQCRTTAECADALLCCPTKCGGRLCRRPAAQPQQSAPAFAIDQIFNTNTAEEIKQLKQRMDEIEVSLKLLNFALKELKPWLKVNLDHLPGLIFVTNIDCVSARCPYRQIAHISKMHHFCTDFCNNFIIIIIIIQNIRKPTAILERASYPISNGYFIIDN